MISSSNFFKKTFFGDGIDEPSIEKRRESWHQQRYQTLQKTRPQVSFLRREKLAQIKSKKLQKKVELPLITSNKLELGFINANPSILPNLSRRKVNKDSRLLPQTYKSLDIRRFSRKKSSNNIDKGSKIIDEVKQIKNRSTIDGMKILGRPTTHFYF